MNTKNTDTTEIYFRHTKLGADSLFFAILVLVGILVIHMGNLPIGILIIIVFVIGIFRNLIKLNDSEAQLIISHDGLNIKNNGFYAWTKITKIQIKTYVGGRSTHEKIIMSYKMDGGIQTIEYNIDDLATNSKELDDLFLKYKTKKHSRT